MNTATMLPTSRNTATKLPTASVHTASLLPTASVNATALLPATSVNTTAQLPSAPMNTAHLSPLTKNTSHTLPSHSPRVAPLLLPHTHRLATPVHTDTRFPDSLTPGHLSPLARAVPRAVVHPVFRNPRVLNPGYGLLGVARVDRFHDRLRCGGCHLVAPGALGAGQEELVFVLGGGLGEVGVRGGRGDARLLHRACVLRQPLARDLAGVGHAYPSPIG
ncbi:hypothetical protein ACSCBZ_28645 [Streptomyces niveiscabiei]|uniref:hypothetical protein n=1 Tax=Streptomyces TaxID=1883 RepID=UPI001F0C5E7E|nr:hypothetical protein [Streptomyces sp. V2]